MKGTIYLNKKSNKPTQDDEKISQQDLEPEGDSEFPDTEKPLVGEILPEDDSYSVKPEDWEKGEAWKPGFLEIEDGVRIEEEKDTPPVVRGTVIDKEISQNLSVVETYGRQNAKLENLSEPFKKYLKRFKEAVIEENKKPVNPVVVDEVATRVAKFYEVIRRIIDWKEAHLIRRTAIERILKRRLVSKIYGISVLPDVDPKEIAEPFVLELVRSGYFPNEGIAKDKIFEVQKVLEKYLYILNNTAIKNGADSGKSKKEMKARSKKKINFYKWIIEIAACEIEDVLAPPLKEYALLDFMTECIYQRIKFVPENGISDETKYIQCYIAVHRTLFNLDAPIISFHLLKYKYPDLFTSEDFIPVFTEKAVEIWGEIEGDLNYKKGVEFHRVAEKYDAAYLMVGDSLRKLENDPNAIDEKVSDPAVLLSLVDKSYNDRLATLKSRLLKLAVFSTLSIFVAGGAALVFFEIPVARLVRGYFSTWAIVADIGIPTALMFILVWMIRPPSGDNLSILKDEVLKVVYKVEELDIYEIKLNKKIRKIVNFIFGLIYVFGGLVSLYLIYWIFKIANVPWTSIYIDTVNVAMVVFSAMVIRQRSKELTMVEKTNVVEFFLDFFSIPLAKMGGWFSKKWKEYNVASIFFSALIDFPFSSFVTTIEGWRNFIKDKQSEIS